MGAVLGKHWDVVNTAGPGNLEIRWAITELEGSSAVASTFTNLIPQTKLLTNIGYMASDRVVFSGRVQIEAQLVDASGQTLYAMRNARQGGTSITNAFSTWGEIKDAFDHWARSAPKQLAALGMKPTKAPIK